MSEPKGDAGLGLVGTRGGRRVISVLVGLIVAALLIWNFPLQRIRNPFRDETRRAYIAVNLDQDWGLFAPDPANEPIFVHAVITRTDGTEVRHDFPEGDPWIGTYRSYRWSSYEESVYFSDDEQELLAEWLLDEYGGSDEVSQVAVVGTIGSPPEGRSGSFDRTTATESLFVLEADG